MIMLKTDGLTYKSQGCAASYIWLSSLIFDHGLIPVLLFHTNSLDCSVVPLPVTTRLNAGPS